VLHSTVWVGDNRYSAEGVTPAGLTTTMDLGVTRGSIRDLGDDTVALSTVAASELGADVGDTLALQLGDGTPARLQVVAVYTRGLGFGAITLPYQLLAGHVDVPMAATVLVAAPASAEPALRVLAAAHPGIHLVQGADLAGSFTTTGDGAVRYLALGLVVGFAAISVVNTLAMATFDRRRELALLRALGATRRQTLRMLRAETLASVATGLVLGAAVGGATLAGFAAGMTGTVVPGVSVPACAAVIVVTCLLAYLGTAAPARLLLRNPRVPG
jgi:putative ABC transport system permease protein